MTVGEVTTVGPVHEDTRDRLQAYRDERGHPNYDAALRELLNGRQTEDNA